MTETQGTGTELHDIMMPVAVSFNIDEEMTNREKKQTSERMNLSGVACCGRVPLAVTSTREHMSNEVPNIRTKEFDRI